MTNSRKVQSADSYLDDSVSSGEEKDHASQYSLLFLTWGILLLAVSELIKDWPFHIGPLIGHLGVAAIVAGAVTILIELPDYTRYVRRLLTDIVLRETYLTKLDPAVLLNLRRSCDRTRLGLSEKKMDEGFYKFVLEEAWDDLVQSHFRTQFTQTATYSASGAPSEFWTRSISLRYTLFRGITEDPLRVPWQDSFDIDEKLLNSRPATPNNQHKCSFTGEKCCFEECRPTEHRCAFLSEFSVEIGAEKYALRLDKLCLERVDSAESKSGPIPVTLKRELQAGRIVLSMDHRIEGKSRIDVRITETKLVRKLDETTAVKMSMPTKDAVLSFTFPEGVITDRSYFGFEDQNPFEEGSRNRVFARIPSWMLPGDGVAVAWRIAAPPS